MNEDNSTISLMQDFTPLSKEEIASKYGPFIKLSFDSDNYRQRMEEIKSLVDRSCFDIWNSVPDEGPRTVSDEMLALFSTRLRSECKNIETPVAYGQNSWSSFLLIKPAYIISGSLLMVGGSIRLGKFLVVLIIDIVIIVILCIIATIRYSFDKIPKGAVLVERDIDPSLVMEVSRSRRRLLENGQKAIAVITDMQYKSFKSPYYVSYDTWLIVREPPRFEITYRFNLSDVDAEALGVTCITHKISVRKDPELDLKTGDSIPILYYVSEKKKISSMPFPFPLDDNEIHGDYLCLN